MGGSLIVSEKPRLLDFVDSIRPPAIGQLWTRLPSNHSHTPASQLSARTRGQTFEFQATSRDESTEMVRTHVDSGLHNGVAGCHHLSDARVQTSREDASFTRGR